MAITSTANQGLEIGRRALQAHQVAINTTSHNIANANTPGYSRRQVNLANAVSAVTGSIGDGADADTVERQRSAFVDAQVRVQQQVLGHWESLERSLRSIEALFNEPAGAGASEAGTVFNESSGVGLSGSLSRFWNTWQDLANVPESGAARAAVRQEGQYLASTLNHLHAQLLGSRLQQDDGVREAVGEVNDLLDQLGALNDEIPRALGTEGGAGDLLDKRDRLIEELAGRIDISTFAHENNQISILTNGHNLLEGDHVVHLAIRQSSVGDISGAQVIFDDDRSAAQIREGRLAGLIEVRDEVLPGLLHDLDEMAHGLVTQINTLHRGGYGRDGAAQVDFFDPRGTSAASIAVDAAILEDVNNIAASGDGNAGDNAVALMISGVRNQKVLASGTATIDSYYHQLLGTVGARSQEAQTMAENHRLFAQQLENSRQSVQGVSLNDEAAQLVMYQRAYQAAARSVSIIDDLLEVVVNI